MAKYELYVRDNYYGPAGEDEMANGFDDYEEAVAAAKRIIDGSLEGGDYKGLTSDQLFKGWSCYGESPCIRGDFDASFMAEVSAEIVAIGTEIERRRKAYGDNIVEILKPIDNVPRSRRFSASEYARQRCRELCHEEDALATVLRFTEWPPELAGFQAVIDACSQREDLAKLGRDGIKTLGLYRKKFARFPESLPKKQDCLYLGLVRGERKYAAFFHPRRFVITTRGLANHVEWKIHLFGSGQGDIRKGDIAAALEAMRGAAAKSGWKLEAGITWSD